MGKKHSYAGGRIWAFPATHCRRTTKGRIVVKSYEGPTVTTKLIGYILYLLSPESSIKTGFEKITYSRIDPESERKGRVKIAFCILLSILLASIIAKLV